MEHSILIVHLMAALVLLWLIFRDRIRTLRGLSVTLALLLLLTGAYNFMTRMVNPPAGWHALIGMKILLALHMISMVLLIARGHSDAQKLERWRRGAFFSGVAVTLIGLYYSNLARL